MRTLKDSAAKNITIVVDNNTFYYWDIKHRKHSTHKSLEQLSFYINDTNFVLSGITLKSHVSKIMYTFTYSDIEKYKSQTNFVIENPEPELLYQTYQCGVDIKDILYFITRKKYIDINTIPNGNSKNWLISIMLGDNS